MVLDFLSGNLEAVVLILLAVVGFTVSWYIRHKTSHQEKLVCVIGEDCDKVVNSKYGKTFGIDNTIGGMLYYSYVFFISLAQFVLPVALFAQNWVLWVKLITSGAAGLFSLYLIGVQVFVLKEYCEYCLVSGGVSFLIFLAVLF